MISRRKLEKVMLINRPGEVLPAAPTMPYAPTTLSPSGRQPIYWLRARAEDGEMKTQASIFTVSYNITEITVKSQKILKTENRRDKSNQNIFS